eukprot:TRINITY_DN7260_c0_g4_i1.p1 TRINITY_DN7260_c0_g4~~TRINITY_DN7260_c0_g4_i1.p1  ORF type:complete len:188 (+),score=58.58 TRINITY_DN7260_c0_g4_i1:126-689(+)
MERKHTAPPVRLSQQTSSLVHSMINTSNLSEYQKRELEKQLKGIDTKPTAKPKRVGGNVGGDPFGSSIKSYGSKKTQGTILDEDPYKRERYLPSSSGDKSKQKEKLQTAMENHGKPKDIPIPKIEPVVKKDRFETLIDEIEDRKKFLEGMRAYGKAEKYERTINQEIEIRIAELELLQKNYEKEEAS